MFVLEAKRAWRRAVKTLAACALVTSGAWAQPIDAKVAYGKIVASLSDYTRETHEQPGMVVESTRTTFDEITKKKVFEHLSSSKLDRHSDCSLGASKSVLAPENASLVNITWGINKDYGFELRQKNAGEQTVSRTFLTSQEAPANYQGQYLRPSEIFQQPASYYISSIGRQIDLLDLPNLDGFELGEARASGENQSVIELEFKYDGILAWKHAASNTLKTAIRSVIRVDADNSYFPTHLNQTAVLKKEEYHTDISWERDLRKGLVTKETVKQRTKLLFESELVIDSRTVIEKKMSYKSVPEDDFRLSAFGFREPRGFQRPENHWPMRLGLIGLLLIGIAVLARLRRIKSD